MIPDHLFSKSILRCLDSTQLPSTLCIALSGGVDSMCLTYLLSRWAKKYRVGLKAITIDHSYRKESANEAALIGRCVEKWCVQHEVHKIEYGTDIKSITNFEEVARTRRYEIFDRVCRVSNASHICVAHTLDDQLETFVQRLRHNSSLFGLAGLREVANIPLPECAPARVRSPVRVIRPLLEFCKADLVATCKENGVKWFEDYTNDDVGLTERNMLRYLINSYVPAQLSETPCDNGERVHLLQSVSKERLLETYGEVRELESTVRNQVRALHSASDVSLDKSNLSLRLSVPVSLSLDLPDGVSVLSRWMYEVFYPISASKHYHWAYAKLERHLVPKIKQHITSSSAASPLKINYLNVLFNITYHDTTKILNINCRRQPFIRNESLPTIQVDNLAPSTWSRWYFFDRRFWLSFYTQKSGIKLHVEPYDVKMHFKIVQELLGKSKEHEFLRNKKYNCIPMVIIHHQGMTDIAFPTCNIYSDGRLVKVDWDTKV
ncbi:Piso0_000811 [Millerozyma farinosa CBS 7064]|uniref:tRNA(Ile)-lysidine synthetase n=1 Tax=Pichia sorbitophila (strain ATCC MYA-4447 / BCRC 22081 / CBS 7064 / NBRC 10061 / NRRL Y-12695) TaxID=559304 RepID=G8YQ47_PICSO|nr:Piso0_000811 [Millerozyma farinosa CBS 7064]